MAPHGRRGAAETHGPTARPAHPAGPAGPRAAARLLRIRTLVAATLANTFVLFASTGVGGFIALYTTRRFGVDLARVGAMVGIPLLIGGLAGNVVGGWLVDWRGRRSARAHLEIAAAASALAAAGRAASSTSSTRMGSERERDTGRLPKPGRGP